MITNILKVIDGGIKYLTLLHKTSHVRRLRAAVDWAERYIFNDEKLKDELNAKERKQIYNRKDYCKRKFFKYNQG